VRTVNTQSFVADQCGTSRIEVIDSAALAERLNLPESWIRDQVRTRANDPIPHLRFGRYVRFQWSHPDLLEWLERKRK
jgi:hypothetical protein